MDITIGLPNTVAGVGHVPSVGVRGGRTERR
jgi:hypothetical protein